MTRPPYCHWFRSDGAIWTPSEPTSLPMVNCPGADKATNPPAAVPAPEAFRLTPVPNVMGTPPMDVAEIVRLPPFAGSGFPDEAKKVEALRFL